MQAVVDGLDVAEVLDPGERGVGHPELLALVDVRRAVMQVQHRGQELGRRLAMLGRVRPEL